MKRLILLLLITIFALVPFNSFPKKVRQKLRVEVSPSSSRKASRKAYSDSVIASDKGSSVPKKVQADSISTFPFSKDSIKTFIPSMIYFAGYDKQATSRYESFHIINRSEATIHKALLTIIYLDIHGKMLHKRDVTVTSLVPPGENRKVDVKTWDTQSSFYYFLSNPPRRVAAPYKVEIKPKFFWITF